MCKKCTFCVMCKKCMFCLMCKRWEYMQHKLYNCRYICLWWFSDLIITLVHISGPPKPESSHHQDWSCQMKPQYMPTSPYTVFIHKLPIQRETVFMCAAVYLSVYAYTEEIKLSSTNMWWIYTGVWEISAFSFFFGISIWTMHHQLAKCAVIVVIISVYPCLLRRNNQCLNQWSPPSIYFTTTTKRCSIFDKKIWRGKASLQQNEIVTFAGKYIVSIYLPLTKLKVMDFFLY